MKAGYKECPYCAEWVREKAKLCRYCGRALEPEGNGGSPEGAGYSVQVEATPETRFRDLGIELSRQHRDRLERFLLGAEEQYRAATILFVDINGYGTMCQKLRAEEIKDILDVYYRICTQLVDFYNGFVLEFQGDGCLAVFGAPVAYDRDAESAVRAALEIRERILALPEMHGQKIRVSAGIETGLVLASVIREKTPHQYKIFGHPVNLAARTEGAAGPGTILVGPSTQDMVKGIFVLKRRPSRRFKHVDRPTVTYEVIGLKLEGQARRDFSVRFVGRKSELALLEKAWTSFAAAVPSKAREAARRPGRGPAARKKPAGKAAAGIVVIGEPGIGKSRLITEFCNLKSEKAARAHVESAPFDVKVPWGLWRRVLIALCGANENDPMGPVLQALRRRLTKLGMVLAETRALPAILGDVDATRELSSMPYANMRRLICSEVAGFLRACAAGRPLVLVLDDLQWADRSSIELLDELVGATVPAVFVVVVHRTGFDLRAPNCARLPQLHLSGLDTKNREALFASLASVGELVPGVRDTLIDKAEGNPFYMLEIARSVIRALEESHARPEGKTLVQTFSEIIPLSLKELLQSRIDSLDQRRKLVVQCASVLGTRFAYELIELFNFIREGLLARLYSLKSIEVLDDAVTRKGLEFFFFHHVTREVAYQSLLDRQRRELHKVVAEQIEAKFRDSLGEYSPILACHFGQAEENERAVQYLELAGERAFSVAAVREALDNYEEALKRLDKCRPGNETRLRRAAILLAMGRAQSLIGQPAAALKSFSSGMDAARRTGDACLCARLRTETGLTLIQTSRYDKAQKELDAALAIARRKDDTHLLGLTLNALGMCFWGRGDYRRARSYYEKVRDLDLEDENPTLGAFARNNLGLLAWKNGELKSAATLFREAFKLRQKSGDKFGMALVLMNLGIIEENLGRYASAGKQYRSALELAEKYGFLQVQTAAQANLANLALATGRASEALLHSARASDLARGIGDLRSEAIALENLALSHLAMRQYEHARSRLGEARRLAKQIGDAERSASLDLVAIELDLARKDGPGDMKRRFARAQRAINSGGFTSEVPRFMRLTALLHLVSGDRDAVRQSGREALEEAKRQHNRTEENRIRALMARAGTG